ncbi:(2Fe-2S)-binding protein [Bordetella genomosp. 11]|uniref:(2Fe-2S)-binding protein n=1 Tax=Bordetella genomosp. 11 TaxID=1416808 RepID=A0A261UJY2_9BORD|nr:(2Fe-2S)-binding protein [Bordetella genomosp. 11]OZI61951.1 (2Fe-2S)-binding protein [Bordetella genomosp. 11]
MAEHAAIAFTLNGRPAQLSVDGERRLLDVLRNDLDLKSSHYGCGSGECGACFVLLDDRAVPACDTPMWAVAGKRVVTSEGLGTPRDPHPLQAAFIAEQAAQCGYCTSGMLIAGAALLQRCPRPSDVQIREGMERNLCRCGTQLRVIKAIRRAAKVSAGGPDGSDADAANRGQGDDSR